MKKILCVLRTSTIRQEIESQKSDMVNFLLSKGYQEEEIEWLLSKGASARSINKAYLEMLETIKRTIQNTPTIKCCAVWHLNRLGRKGRYLDEMKNWFIDNHIQLICKTPQMQLLNDDGSYNIGNNIIFSVYSSTIEGDTQETMDKTLRGKKYQKAKGLWVGERLNYGFTHTKDKHIVVDSEKMGIVQLIYSEYATGNYSQFSLSKELASRGIDISERLIHRILNNEIYKPYIDPEVFEKATAIKEGNNSNKTKESKHTHLALKIFRCQCGAAYIASCGRYRCLVSSMARRFPTETSKCEHPSIDSQVIDFLLWDVAKHLHRGYITTNSRESEKELRKQQEVIFQKLQHLEEEKEKKGVKLERAKDLYLDGDLTKSEYTHRKAEIEAEFGVITNSIEYFNKQMTLIGTQIEALHNPSYVEQFMLLASVGGIEDVDKQREIILQHIKNATIVNRTFNNHKATEIIIENNYGNIYRFIYDFKDRKANNFKERLYIINGDESVTPFGKFDIDNFYKKSYQTALMIESEEGRKIRQFLKEQGAGDDIIKSIEDNM